MDTASGSAKQHKLLTDVVMYVTAAKGLRGSNLTDGTARIEQMQDGKYIDIVSSELDEVLFRADTDGRDFIQVNFRSGAKILLTESLIGFKPSPPRGMDVSKLPRVVTTPDIVSVFEAIQDALHSASPDEHEISVLKKVYEAVLTGGEAIGFDLKAERSWIARIPTTFTKMSA